MPPLARLPSRNQYAPDQQGYFRPVCAGGQAGSGSGKRRGRRGERSAGVLDIDQKGTRQRGFSPADEAKADEAKGTRFQLEQAS